MGNTSFGAVCQGKSEWPSPHPGHPDSDKYVPASPINLANPANSNSVNWPEEIKIRFIRSIRSHPWFTFANRVKSSISRLNLKSSVLQPLIVPEPIPLLPGDYYFNEQGLMVFTEQYHRRRGYCCKSGCRHCPYGFEKEKGKKQ